MSLKKKTEGIVPEMVFNNILTTAHKVERNSKIILSTDADTYEAVQEVVKVGPSAAYGGNPQVLVEVGDIIVMDITHFMKRKTANSLKDDIDLTKEYHEVDLPVVAFHNKEYMKITDRDILYYWKSKKEDIDEAV